MEIYLFIALIFMYILTTFFLPDNIQKRLWTTAYIVSFAMTAVAVAYIKDYAADTLMKVGEINWYYILYVFGSICLALGIINLWIYKHGLANIFFKKSSDK